jgi:hypothetical protein
MEPIIITPQPEWFDNRTVWATISLPTDVNVLETIITQCPRPAGIEMRNNHLIFYKGTSIKQKFGGTGKADLCK